MADSNGPGVSVGPMKRNLVVNGGEQSSGALARRRQRLFVCLLLGCCLWTGLCVQGRGEGIPEPDLIWYGRVLQHGNGPVARLTAGTLEWMLQPTSGGPARVLTVTLTNVNDHFSYALRIPCESTLPGLSVAPDRLPIQDPPVSFDRTEVTWNGLPLELQTGTATFTLSPDQRGRVERLDFALFGAVPDSDGDGLPDWWESQYFGQQGTHPLNDSDSDGLTDAQEYAAGTDPLDSESVLAVVAIVPTETGILLEWTSAAGKTYRVLRSSDLSAGAEDFSVVEEGILATPPLNTLVDTGDTGTGMHFYRVQIEH
jgi:hypothetical protein